MNTTIGRSSCTSILIGKKASLTGSVVIGRNEDAKTAWPKHLAFNPHKAIPNNHFKSKDNKFEMDLPEERFSYSSTPEWTDKYGAFEDLHIRWTFSGNADKSTLGELEEMIKLEISSSDVSEEKNIEKMKLRQAYERHRDYAGEMIKKVRIYSNKYTQEWISSIFDRGSGENAIAPEEIERFYFSNYLQEEKFNKRPLSKMTKDIFKEYFDE